jgi:hypothetical protein
MRRTNRAWSRRFNPKLIAVASASGYLFMVALNPNQCPADPAETAEGYIMDTLDNSDAEIFEQHCLICCRCLAVLDETERYVRAMRIATQRVAAR